jgi:hypothetical protein
MTFSGDKFSNLIAPTADRSPYEVHTNINFTNPNIPDITTTTIDSIQILPPIHVDTSASTISPSKVLVNRSDTFEVDLELENLSGIVTDNNEVTVELDKFGPSNTTVSETTTFDASEISDGDTLHLTVTGSNFQNLTAPSPGGTNYAVNTSVDVPDPAISDLSDVTVDQIEVQPLPALRPSSSEINPNAVTEGETTSLSSTVRITDLQSLESDNNRVEVRLVNFADGTSTDIAETETFDASDVKQSDSSISVQVSGGNFNSVVPPTSSNSPYGVNASVNFTNPKLPDYSNQTIDDITVGIPQPKLDAAASKVEVADSPVVEGSSEIFQVTVKLSNLTEVTADNNSVTLRLVNFKDGTSTDVTRVKTFDDTDINPDQTIDLVFRLLGVTAPTSANSPYRVEADADFTEAKLNDLDGMKFDEIYVQPP